jgi:hypothetical protein
MVFAAVTVVVLLGVTGLVLDAGNLSDYRHRIQTAADAAAIAGAREVRRNKTISAADLQTFVNRAAAENGFTNGSNGISITVHHAPTPGSFAGNSRYVEVIISRAVPTYFMGMFGRTEVDVGIRSVAGAGASGGCLVALSGTEGKAFQTSGSGINVDFQGCSVAVNSTATDAFFISSSGTVSANGIDVVGGASYRGANVTPTPSTNATPMSDPLSDLAEPTPGVCTPAKTDYRLNSGTAVLSPGTYCGEIIIQNATVSFSPGLYILKDGALNIKGSSVITGTGVTFFTVGTTSKATSLSSSSSVTLSAPTTGPYAGILFADRLNDPGLANTFSAGTMVLNGVVYYPHQHVEWKGGGAADYTILITDTIKFTGNSVIKSDYSALPGGSPVGLVSRAEM